MYDVCSLFSGIGGIDLGFLQAGYNIVFANEIDSAACKTYRYNFKNSNLTKCDIKQLDEKYIPDFDILVAGFPCQPFSIAGKQRGFSDKRGNLFFEITRIVDKKRPKVIFLENVANLLNHDNGKTFLVIYNSLAQFGYSIYYKVMSATEYGNLPQTRKRIYIVAVRENCHKLYSHIVPIELNKNSVDIIVRTVKQNDIYYYKNEMFGYLDLNIKNDNLIYQLTDRGIRKTSNGLCPTLTASMGTFKDRVPIIRDNFGIRKLTLRECLDFQGFPPEYYFPNSISINDAYKQIGNSVCVPVIKRIAESIKEIMLYFD